MKAKLGPDHPETLITANVLADSYEARAGTTRARLRQDSLALCKVRGPHHPYTLLNLSAA